MICLAVPVIGGGEHVATLHAGQVFDRRPTRRQFARLMKSLAQSGRERDWPRLAKHWRATTVIPPDRLAACTRLLVLFADLMDEFADRWIIAAQVRYSSRNCDPIICAVQAVSSKW